MANRKTPKPTAASKPTARAAHGPADLVVKRARLMQYDADRLEIWQRTHKNLAPTQESAYGFMVADFLDQYEAAMGIELLPEVERPKVAP